MRAIASTVRLQWHQYLHVVPGKEPSVSIYLALQPVLVNFISEGNDVAFVEPQLTLVLRLKVVRGSGGGSGLTVGVWLRGAVWRRGVGVVIRILCIPGREGRGTEERGGREGEGKGREGGGGKGREGKGREGKGREGGREGKCILMSTGIVFGLTKHHHHPFSALGNHNGRLDRKLIDEISATNLEVGYVFVLFSLGGREDA